MPIHIETISDDLYLLQWEGDITLREIQESHEMTSQLAADARVESYIHILDVSHMKSFPLDFSGLLSVLLGYPRVFAVLVVGGTLLARSVVRILDGTSKQVTLKSYTDIAQAKEDALALLTEKRQVILET